MPRRRLTGCGGFVFHVMNRSAKQLALFEAPDDFDLFLEVLAEAEERCPIRLLEYCVMPNHFHLLVWPETDTQLSTYMRWITGVHGQRWRRQRGLSGKGAVYQGRFRWVAVQSGEHYDIARRYIWQNPVRARLADQARTWPWSSASDAPMPRRPTLDLGPLLTGHPRQAGLEQRLEASAEHEMREALRRGVPFGTPGWSRTLELREWLIAVLRAHSAAQAPATIKKPKKTDSSDE